MPEKYRGWAICYSMARPVPEKWMAAKAGVEPIFVAPRRMTLMDKIDLWEDN